jgi:threonylcarbamoyladenosine tRNA methylthiotransferase MtaB
MPTLSGVDAALVPAVDAVLPAGIGGGLGAGVGPAGHLDGIAGDRAREERTRAFVKVQDGCSFHCTYCVIPRARGAERSLAPVAVIADVRRALAAGHREIVLTGINIGTYDGGASERGPRGSHRWEALSLAGLIRRILDATPVERLRLSSIEPQHVSDDLLRAWTDAPERCLPHFHLPLQSGDDGVLRRMGRRYDARFYAGLVGRIRSAVPGVAVHADVIVGFPTEDDAAWARSRAFIEGLELAGIHVFRYSERTGTAAVRMTGRVPGPIRRARAAELLGHAAERRAAFAARQVGRRATVLLEQQLADGRWMGHTENHVLVAVAAPERHLRSLENVLARVDITGVDERADRCRGRIVTVVRGGARGR